MQKSLLFLPLFLFLAACQQITSIQPNTGIETELDQTPIFTDKILDGIVKQSTKIYINESLETLVTESNYISSDKKVSEEFLNIESLIEDVEIEDAKITSLHTQTTLVSSDGFIVYIAQNGIANEIWRHDQSDDSQTLVYTGSRDIQSVAITLDGDTIAAVMDREATTNTFINQNTEVFAFKISTLDAQLQTVTGSDEADISISGDGKVWTWQGRNRINNKQAIVYRIYDTNGNSLDYIVHNNYDIEQPSITQNGKLITFRKSRDGSYYADGTDRWVTYAYNIAIKKSFGLVVSKYPLGNPSLNNDGSKLLVERGRSIDDKRIVQLFDLIERKWLTPVFTVQNDSVHAHLTADGLFAAYAKRTAKLNSNTRDISPSTVAVTNIAKDTDGHFWQKASTLPYAGGYSSTPNVNTAFNFASVAVESSSTAQTLVFSGTGTSDLRIGYRIVGLDRADFEITPNPSHTIAIGEGDITATITCSPTASGTRIATLVVFTNDITQLRATYPLNCEGLMVSEATDLFFSEYGEGSSNNKWIEIYNGTSAAIDLSDYQIERASNGDTFPGAIQVLSGILAIGDTYVLCHSSVDASIIGNCDSQPGIYINHNGNDAYALRKISSSSIIDVIGNDSSDPGSGWTISGISNATKDHTLVRKATVCSGNSDWDTSKGIDITDSEWIVEDKNNFSFIGAHIGCQ